MIRTLSALLLTLACTWAVAALPPTQVVKLNDRIYAMFGPEELPNAANRGYMVNTTAIIGERGVILVDTGWTDEIGNQLKAEIAKVTDLPVTHIINTHHHGDHVLGNSVFEGAEILSAERCRELVEQTGYEWLGLVEQLTGLKFPNTRPVPASVTYPPESRTRIELQGVELELWVPPGSHTEGDLMVYLPEDRILLAGDVLVNGITPNFRDGNVKNWIATLEEIQALDVEHIVPGHGPLMTLEQAAAMRDRMGKLYADVKAGYEEGLMASQIRDRSDLSEWEKLKHFEEIMGGNLSRAYLEVEQELF
jgi:glyoxylase-like metal-dependent hydrolase (beta-lactamase superfamily II)